MKWEYLVVTVDRDGNYAYGGCDYDASWYSINKLGVEGWELVAVAFDGKECGRGFFKRPVKESDGK